MLCSACAGDLRVALVDVPELLHQLDITRSRQDQLTDPADRGPPGRETPLPFKPRVAEVVWILHNTLGAWITVLQDRAIVANNPTAQAQWLIRNLAAAQRCPTAGQLFDEVTHAIRNARRAIDCPDDDRRLFLGPCSTGACVEEVYGLPGLPWVTCPGCGAAHHTASRQQWMYEQAQDHLGSAVEIAGFLRVLGVKCTPAMIYGYAARKRLIPAGYRELSPLYRIRDVLATIQDRYTHKAR